LKIAIFDPLFLPNFTLAIPNALTLRQGIPLQPKAFILKQYLVHHDIIRCNDLHLAGLIFEKRCNSNRPVFGSAGQEL
jgi:hypothetical protein